MPSIVVTGAAGFIGSHTCDHLLAQGREVVGVDNFRSGRRENLQGALCQPNFRLVEIDVLDPEALARLLAEVRPAAVIHLAALVSVQESLHQPHLNYRLNVHATQVVAEAVRLAGVRRLVFASSAAVYGDPVTLPVTEDIAKYPLSPYGSAKLTSETLLRAYGQAFGIEMRCLRYFNVYGARQDPTSPYSGVISIFRDKLAARQPPVIFGDGRQTRDFISVRDIARANALAATAEGGAEIVNICTGQATTLRELAAMMGRMFPAAPPPVANAARHGDILHSVGDPTRAADQLGFLATIKLEEGIGEFCAAGT